MVTGTSYSIAPGPLSTLWKWGEQGFPLGGGGDLGLNRRTVAAIGQTKVGPPPKKSGTQGGRGVEGSKSMILSPKMMMRQGGRHLRV